MSPVARDISAGAIASTKPTGWVRSHGPDSVIVVSTRAPNAATTPCAPSAAVTTPWSSPATSKHSSGCHPRAPSASSRPSAATSVRRAAMRRLACSLSMP